MKLLKNPLIILIYFSVYTQNYLVLARETRICRVYNIEQCKKTPNSIVDVKEFRIYNSERASTVFYMEVDVSHNLDTDPSLEILVQKCLARESPDTCEIFTTLKPSNPCMFMFMKNMMWSNFVYNIQPLPACRVRKGHYVLQNATLDPELFQVFPITGFSWKIELKFSAGVDYTSICVDSQIISVHV